MIHWSHLLFSKCHSIFLNFLEGVSNGLINKPLFFRLVLAIVLLSTCGLFEGSLMSMILQPVATGRALTPQTSSMHPRPPLNSKSTCESPLLRLFSQLVSPQNSHMETTWGWAHWDSQVTSPYWVQNYSALLTINALLSGQCLCWHSLSPANLLCDPGQNI